MSGDFFDAYAVLRVSHDVDAGGIRAMHRELAKRHHPDRGGTAADAGAMSRINHARDTLLDPAARAKLDEEIARREREAERSKAAAAQSGTGGDTGGTAKDWADEWGQEVAWSTSTPPAPPPEPPRFNYLGYDTAPPVGSPYQNWTRSVRPPLDGVSIASFVLSIALGLTCGGPPALVLAVIGLFRTARGKRRGRWAAVWGGILGSISTTWITLTLIQTLTSSA